MNNSIENVYKTQSNYKKKTKQTKQTSVANNKAKWDARCIEV